MGSGRARRSEVLATETEFWERIAAEPWVESELRIPTASDLADPFAYSSDRKFLEKIGPVEGLRVLDIGCGKGSLSLYLASRGAHVTGLDITKGMVTRCRKRFALVKLDAHLVVGDAELQPFRDYSFDRVVGQRTIHHLQNLDRFFEEVYRVLMPNGRAVFVEPQKRNPFVEFNRKVLHPSIRTQYEHPLVRRDLEQAKKAFPYTEVETFYLISPVAWFFRYVVRSDLLYRTTSNILQTVESRLARSKILRPYCWQVVLTLTRKDRSSTSKS